MFGCVVKVLAFPSSQFILLAGPLKYAPPNLESISLLILPLPPVTPGNNIRAYTSEVKPNGTGCIILGLNEDF
jgi:hypothetical protein